MIDTAEQNMSNDADIGNLKNRSKHGYDDDNSSIATDAMSESRSRSDVIIDTSAVVGVENLSSNCGELMSETKGHVNGAY